MRITVFTRAEQRLARRRFDRQAEFRRHQRLDTAVKSGTDRLPKIQHIVVLMMENHSYDNYFGMLKDRGEGLELGDDGQPVATNVATDGTVVRLEPYKGTVQTPGVPTQTWNASHIQRGDGQCGGFVKSIEWTLKEGSDRTLAMRYWTEEDLPFYYGLAKTFPLATNWFSSCLGPTFPNRRFLIAGTAHGLIDDLPFAMVDYPKTGTVFDHLTAHGITWTNYHKVPAWRVNFKRIFRARGVRFFRLIIALLSTIFPKLIEHVQSKIQVTADLFPLGTLRSINHLRSHEQFFADAEKGTLPDFCIVDPDFGKTSEENPQDIEDGEEFAARVINAVMGGKAWSKTLLIWLYDEHGGYYDHVDPPEAVDPGDLPAADPLTRFALTRFLLRLTPWWKLIQLADDGPSTYDRLGFRVPAVVVSPYAKKQHVSYTPYDHTSVLKLLQEKWNLPPLTDRDAAAKSLLDMLDLDSPPTFPDGAQLPQPGKGARIRQ
jgi:phospholipase C